jgi:hypothetical protein
MSAFLPVISTRFPLGKPRSTRKRQTGTGVFYLLFVGRLNSKNVQQRKLPLSDRFSHAGISWIS